MERVGRKERKRKRGKNVFFFAKEKNGKQVF